MTHQLGTPEADHTVVACVAHKYCGVRYMPGQTYHMAQGDILTNATRGLVHPIGVLECDWWGAPGRVLEPESVRAVGYPDGVEPVHSREASPGALRIVAGCSYDPGSAAFRFHSALNRESHHASAFARWGHANPHCDLRQYDALTDAGAIRQAIHEADVIHCHVDYILTNNSGIQPRAGQRLVRHYHGSPQGGRTPWPQVHAREDDTKGAILVGARLTLVADREPGRIHWLPIPVPVDWYAALAAQHRPEGTPGVDRPLRIAHSPSSGSRKIKGSDAVTRVVRQLKARGLPVEFVLIQGVSLSRALEMKASCDVTFDSFWLGIQGSGLEAAAMGQAVIAGDASVAALYEQHVGHVPYSFAPDEQALACTLERMAVDPAYRSDEAARVSLYVREYHDYAAVARRYEDILVTEGFPETIRTPAQPVVQRAPTPERQAPAKPKAPARKRPARKRPPKPETR